MSYTKTQTHTHTHVCTYVYTYIHSYKFYIHTHIHTYTHTHIHTYTHTHTHTPMQINYTYICICMTGDPERCRLLQVSLPKYIYIHTYIHTHTHTHKHTNTGYFAIGIVGAKTAQNVGSLWRSAFQMGASYIFTIGARYRNSNTDVLHAHQRIPCFEFRDWSHFSQVCFACVGRAHLGFVHLVYSSAACTYVARVGIHCHEYMILVHIHIRISRCKKTKSHQFTWDRTN